VVIFWSLLQQLCTEGSWSPSEPLTGNITLSTLLPDNPNPALSCLGCTLPQELQAESCVLKNLGMLMYRGVGGVI